MNQNKSVAISQILFIINAAIWLILGIADFLYLANRIAMLILLIITLLMFANAGVMLWLAWGLGKQSKLFFYCALGVMAVNIILTFTDEFGFYDLLALLFEVAIVVFLIVTRSLYLSTKETT